MKFLRRLFGKCDGSKPMAAESSHAANPSPSTADAITVYDKFGRELLISRDEWRDSVLPASLQSAWNDAERLHNIVVSALDDGLRTKVINAAEHLYEIDPNRVRAACLWGIVLSEENRLGDAERVLRDALVAHGEDGYVLTNLAKVQDRQGRHAESAATLWHALEVDPNQANALAWYVALEQERAGPPAAQAAYRRIAAIRGSWRAQLWIAREALEARDLQHARVLYEASLANAGEPPPTELLMQMSGDLGQHDHLRELIALTESRFDPLRHGIMVGNNLIKAHVDLGQFEAARQTLDRLYALKRPDWKDTLASWDTTIARDQLQQRPTDISPLDMTVLSVEGPIWLPDPAPWAEVFAPKSLDEFLICFLCGTAETDSEDEAGRFRLADSPGRLTRALPMYLAEHVHFASRARTRTLTPWITRGGFILVGSAPTDDEAVQSARQSAPDCHCVVTTHICARGQLWRADLRVIRVADGACLASLNSYVDVSFFRDEIPTLAQRLVQSLIEHADVQPAPTPVSYRVPPSPAFGSYLLKLEQLLAVRCAAMDNTDPGFLNGARSIIDDNIRQCVEFPDMVVVRLLLAQTMLSMKQAEPNIPAEFRETIAALQLEHRLPAPSHLLVQRVLNQSLRSD